jgi:hypothetical protein
VTTRPAGTFQAALLVFRNDVTGPRRLVVEPAGAGEATTSTLPAAGVDGARRPSWCCPRAGTQRWAARSARPAEPLAAA